MSRAYKEPATSSREKSSNKRDPRHRHHDGARLWNELVNADPSKRYIWVNKSAQDQGIGYYEGLGYEIVLESPDGKHAKPARGRTVGEGSAVEMRGNVLMCIDRKVHEEMYRQGWDGDGGQEFFDEIEDRILGKGFSRELARSSRSYMQIQNDGSKVTLSDR